MAENIVKFKVDSSEYEQKIRRASQTIQGYARDCQASGQSMAKADQNAVKFASDLGRMETVATSLRGKINEMTSAYTDLRSQYNRLSDDEKKSDFGRAMSSSLDQLKGRIGEAKNELKDINGELGESGNKFDGLSSKLGVSIKQLATFGGVLAAGKTAMEVYNRTIQATEGTSDAYNIVQLQLNDAVDSFFRNINEGNFTNFLSGLSDVAQRAKDAYIAMDELSSFAVRYNPKNQADMQRIDKLMKEARALMAKGDKAGAAAKTAEAKEVAKQAEVNTTAYGQKEYNAGIKTLQRLLGGTGVTYTEDQLIYYSDPANWEAVKKSADEYKKKMDEINRLRSSQRNSRRGSSSIGYIPQMGADNGTQAIVNARSIELTITDEMRRAYNYLNTRDTAGTEQGDAFIRATQQIYGKEMAGYAVDAIRARIDRADAMATKPVTTGGGNGATTERELSAQQKIQKQINDLIEEAYTATDERRVAIRGEVSDLQKQLKVYSDIKDEVMGIKKEGPKTVTGTSITSMSGMSSYISTLQEELNKIDFGKEGADAIYKSISQSLADTTMLQNLVSESLKLGIGTAMFDVADETGKDFWTRAMEGGVENVDWQAIVDKINEKRKEMGLDAIIPDYGTGTTSSGKGNNKTEKKDSEKLSAIASDIGKFTGGVSNIASGLQSLGVEIPKGMQDVLGGIQAVVSILTGISAIVSVIEALTAVKAIPVVGTFAANGAVIGNAAGGMIIPGNNFSGDRLRMPVAGGGMIGVNSGEVVLNRAQTNNLASALEGGGQQIAMQPYVDGEKIFLGMNNTSKRMGRGEIVTTGMLRRLGLM